MKDEDHRHVVEEIRRILDQGPYYDPLYDSPIEDQLAYHIVKYLRKDVSFLPQYKVHTFCATYRLDFFLSLGGTAIGIECDGSKYHDQQKDRIRDTLILGSGTVDTIFRLNGRNIVNNLNDCLWLIAQFRPKYFPLGG
jgi:very-short-patch-repair endonuclease